MYLQDDVIKEIKHWMIDNDYKMRHVAELMECSRSFVSIVLQGRKKMPDSWLNKLPSYIHARILRQEIQETKDELIVLQDRLTKVLNNA